MSFLDCCSLRLAACMGIDPCVMLVKVRWFFAVRPQVRAVWRTIVERVEAGESIPGRYPE